jgi:hypothetical protein
MAVDSQAIKSKSIIYEWHGEQIDSDESLDSDSDAACT